MGNAMCADDAGGTSPVSQSARVSICPCPHPCCVVETYKYPERFPERSISPSGFAGETRQRKFLVRTPWLDKTTVSPGSPPRPARRLAKVEHLSETSDSELDTEDEFQRRRTGGTAGGRWDRSNARSALAKVVEQNQPAYLYSL